MATEVIKTIKPSSGDYSSLSAWEAAIPADLTSVDEKWIAECYDFSGPLTDSVTFSEHLSNITNDQYCVIRAATGESFHITSNVSWGKTILLDSATTLFVENIKISHPNKGYSVHRLTSNNARLYLDCCIIEGSNTLSETGIYLQGDDPDDGVDTLPGRMSNCYIYDMGSRGIYISDRADFKIFNNTSEGSRNGYEKRLNENQCHFKNNVGYNNGNADFIVGANVVEVSNNASSDLTAPGANSITSITSTEFVDAANGDFNIATGSSLIDAGVDLSTEFTNDINGNTRG